MNIVSGLKEKLGKYFSGRLVLIQIAAGVGAVAGRSAAVYLLLDQETWIMVLASMAGSFAGYISFYSLGYWITFRSDYRVSGRFMALDIVKLQLVEQLPNIGTVLASGLTQGALIGGAGMQPVLAANLGSWFGPQKIINLAAMLASNTLKRAWVDGSWKPMVVVRSLIQNASRIGR